MPTINELLIKDNGNGGYSYYAKSCSHEGSYCDPSAASYEREGSVEREFYNGYPPLVFKNTNISIRPLCGGMLTYQDKGNGPVSFFFRREECSKSETVTGKGEVSPD